MQHGYFCFIFFCYIDVLLYINFIIVGVAQWFGVRLLRVQIGVRLFSSSVAGWIPKREGQTLLCQHSISKPVLKTKIHSKKFSKNQKGDE